ncbi:hypothetical protein CHUAL_001598 [Chamberlinius hualienensis]
MIIESPEALKEWLTSVLEPLCDADPTALAKYVIALVKKDKNVNELRDTCVDQLDVFLQHETKPFVELLFKTLDDKSYLAKTENNSSPVSTTNSVEQVTSTTTASVAVVNNVSTTASTSSTSTPTVTMSITNATKVTERRISRPEASVDEDRDSKRSTRKSARSHSRSRSGSRGRNRSRSRSRDRDDRRIRRFDDDRRRRGVVGGRRYDRYNDYRRDRSRDRLDKKRSRSRSLSRSRSRSRSHSRTRDRTRTRGENSQKQQSSPPRDHGDTDYRFGATGTSTTNASNSVQPPPTTTSGNSNVTNTESQSFPAGRNARRCRDYDEKGYCMRGDLCPYDHGADPVVVEEVHLPTVLGYGGGVAGVPPGTAGGRPPLPPNTRPPAPPTGVLPPLLGPPIPHPRPPIPPPAVSVHPVAKPYNPEAPGMDRMPPRMRPPFWGPRLAIGRGPLLRPPQFIHAPRELISVPTVDDQRDNMISQKRAFENSQGNPGRVFRSVGNTSEPLAKRRVFDHNRLGNRKFNNDNAMLELRKIPQGLNSITQLNNHFSKFGKIVNLQVCYEGDPEAALIQFSSHAEAHAAHRSTEAVLNNRFIKVFWHNKDGEVIDKQENNSIPKRVSAKERLGVPVGKDGTEQPDGTTQTGENIEKSSVIMSTSGSLSKTVFNPSALKKCNLTAPNSSSSSQVLSAQETIKKKQAEQRKEAMKIKVDLVKRKQDLLQKQIQQQKVLIEKLDRNKNMSATERTAIIETIKLLQESIEKLKAELVANVQTNHPKTKQEAQKEILDIEMELYSKQHQGADTTALKKKVAELKSEAMSLGLLDQKAVLNKVVSKRSSRGSFRGRSRGGVNSGVRSVDHRPKRLQIGGFDEEEKEEIVKHFARFGEFENIEPCEDGLQLLLTYHTRREAEMAVSQGVKFKGKMLILSWYRGPNYVSGSSSGLVGEGGLAVEDEHFDAEHDVDDGLLADDDEEEDSEARSWRR